MRKAARLLKAIWKVESRELCCSVVMRQGQGEGEGEGAREREREGERER